MPKILEHKVTYRPPVFGSPASPRLWVFPLALPMARVRSLPSRYDTTQVTFYIIFVGFHAQTQLRCFAKVIQNIWAKQGKRNQGQQRTD